MYSLLLCLCLSIGTALAQNITVKGTVTSAEDGSPVIGASVFVQGTKNGTVTDNSGQYTLREVPAGSTLVFSCIGMIDVKKTADRVVDATLTVDNELLDEVVVTAQGLTRKQKAIGYSAQTVTAKDLTIVHSADLGNSLAGKVAERSSGVPAVPHSMRERSSCAEPRPTAMPREASLSTSLTERSSQGLP